MSQRIVFKDKEEEVIATYLLEDGEASKVEDLFDAYKSFYFPENPEDINYDDIVGFVDALKDTHDIDLSEVDEDEDTYEIFTS